MDESKPVMVGVDGSQASMEALREASTMAELLGSPLRVVAAWQWPAASGELPETIGWNPEDDARERLAESLTAVFGDTRPEGLEEVVRQGQPAKVLTDLSKDSRMVVVGSRGLGGFKGLLLGSVSSTVGAHSACPVLIVHGKAA